MAFGANRYSFYFSFSGRHIYSYDILTIVKRYNKDWSFSDATPIC